MNQSQVGVCHLLLENLSHGQINKKVGTPGAYTDAVDAFIHTVTGVGTT